MEEPATSEVSLLVDVPEQAGECKEHNSVTSRVMMTGSYLYLFFVIGLVQGIIGGSLLALQKHVHVTEAWIGTLVLARGLGWLGGSLSSAWLFSRYDAHRLLIGALGVMVLAHVAVPFVPVFAALFAVFFGMGLAGGVVEAGGNTVLIWLWRERVGQLLQFLNFAIGVGALVAPLLMAGFLMEESLEFSVLSSYLSLAFLMIPPIVLLASYRSPAAYEPPPDTTPASAKRSLSILVCMCLFALAISGIEISTSSWLPLFSKDTFGWSPAKCDLVTTVFYVGFTAARLVFSLVPSRLVPGQHAMFGLIGLLVAGVAMLVYASLTHGGVLVFVAVGVLGFGLGPLCAIGMSLPIESPAHYLLAAKDVALVIAMSNVGELGTPLVLSLSWSMLGPSAYLATSSLMTLATVGSGVWLYLLCFANQ
jgi:FHS family Na+ dependent glucose MFS transporter 1